MVRRIAAQVLVVFLVCALGSARAEVPSEFKKIPQKPSAPPTFSGSPPNDPFHCQRIYEFGGKTYDCDSLVARDAQRLRAALGPVPEAVRELDEYRNARRMTENSAYVISGGIALAILGGVVGRVLGNSFKGSTIRDMSTFVGLWVGGNAFLFNLSFTRAGDEHIQHAVDLYNQARPDQPMGIQFSIPLGAGALIGLPEGSSQKKSGNQ
ncbi:hypothetical protein WDW37_11080 [Bdellovibrionota bacterium FG-1]